MIRRKLSHAAFDAAVAPDIRRESGIATEAPICGSEAVMFSTGSMGIEDIEVAIRIAETKTNVKYSAVRREDAAGLPRQIRICSFAMHVLVSIPTCISHLAGSRSIFLLLGRRFR